MTKPNPLLEGRWSVIAASAVVIGVAGLMVGFEVKSPIGGMSTKSSLVTQGIESAQVVAERYPGSQAVVTDEKLPMLLVPVSSEEELLVLQKQASDGGVLLLPYFKDVSIVRLAYEEHESALQALPAITFEVRSDRLDDQGARAVERLAALVKAYPYITELTSVSDGAVSPDLAERRLESLLSTLEGHGASRLKIKTSVIKTNNVVEKRITTKATLQWQTS